MPTVAYTLWSQWRPHARAFAGMRTAKTPHVQALIGRACQNGGNTRSKEKAADNSPQIVHGQCNGVFMFLR